VTVGHVTPWGVKCGIAKHLSYWRRFLPETRREIILASHPPQWLEPIEDWPGPKVIRCYKRGEIDLVNLRQAATETGCHILHLQWDPSFYNWKGLLGLSEWAEQAGVLITATLHVVLDEDPFAREMKMILRVADQVVVGTPAMKAAAEDVAAKYQITPRRPIRVIPLSHPEVWFKGREGGGRRPLILTWGMPGALKRQGMILEAVRLLRRQGYPNARFVIAGNAITGEQRNAVAAIRQDAAGEPDILQVRDEWLGDQMLADLCCEADVIVLNHEWPHPSSSGTIALSVASGTPVVVARSTMYSGYEGATFQIRDDNANGIARAIARALKDPRARDQGIGEVLLSIEPKAVAAQYEDVYRQIEGATE